MKLAIDIRSATDPHKTGKGRYTFQMVQNLITQNPQRTFHLFTESLAPEFQYPNTVIHVIAGSLWHLKAARLARKLDISHYFSPSSYVTPCVLGKEIKTVMTVHDLASFLLAQHNHKRSLLIEKLFLRWALKRVAKVIAISKNTAKDLERLFGYTSTEVIYCAASDEFRPMNLPREKFFLAVGTIEPRKNYPVLVKAFSVFVAKNPEYRLKIVGKQGWGVPLKLGKNIDLLGYKSNEELARLYNTAQAFIFPSHYEGFGIPLVEAMSCGAPVIAANTSSIPEVVGDAALLFDPNKPEELLQLMLELPSHRELSAKSLAQAKRFSWATAAQDLLGVLQGLSSDADGRRAAR